MKVLEIHTSNSYPLNGNIPIELWVLEDGRHVILNPASGDEYYESEEDFDAAYAGIDIQFKLTDRTGEIPDPQEIIDRIKELCSESAQAFVDEFGEALKSDKTDWDAIAWGKDFLVVATEFGLPLGQGTWGSYWSQYYDLKSETRRKLNAI